MSHPKRDQDGEDGKVVISVRASVIRWLLTAALGAGGGFGGSMGEHRLRPAEVAAPAPAPVTEQLEGKLRLQRLEDDLHGVKERAAEDRGRIGKLEERLVPAGYRAPGR